MNCRENRYILFNLPPRVERGGRTGGRGQGEREREREAGREGGARAKPGNQLVLHNLQSHCSASFMFASNHVKSFNELM